VFINFSDNAALDSQGFAPFGQVTSGMNVVDGLYSGYGEGAPGGGGPDQSRVQREGNAYLTTAFPKLDYIKSATERGTRTMAEALPAGVDPENTLVLETTPGRIVIKLRTDVAPGHAERLKQLAREEFYDDVPFHRVIDGFMAQTGDGEFGNGTGGSQHPDLKSEFSDVPFKRGVVGMARTSNPHSANSQFFIMFDDGSFLNGQYTVVGEVVSGMDIVDKLKRGEPPRNPDKIIKMQVAADVK
jgi:peptidylprolyl isomerase